MAAGDQSADRCDGCGKQKPHWFWNFFDTTAFFYCDSPQCKKVWCRNCVEMEKLILNKCPSCGNRARPG